MMGQMLAMFLPKRAKPAMRPSSTMVKPLGASLHSQSSPTLMRVTRAELTKAAEMPAIWM